MATISYEQLFIEVERLYQKSFSSFQNEKDIEDHCLFIQQFIESTGWTVEEYMQEYIHRGLKDYLPETNLRSALN